MANANEETPQPVFIRPCHDFLILTEIPGLIKEMREDNDFWLAIRGNFNPVEFVESLSTQPLKGSGPHQIFLYIGECMANSFFRKSKSTTRYRRVEYSAEMGGAGSAYAINLSGIMTGRQAWESIKEKTLDFLRQLHEEFDFERYFEALEKFRVEHPKEYDAFMEQLEQKDNVQFLKVIHARMLLGHQ